MFITDNPIILKDYLDVRERQGLFHKSRKHLFVTSNELVKDVVYSNEEFQYHGNTGYSFILLMSHFQDTSPAENTLLNFI